MGIYLHRHHANHCLVIGENTSNIGDLFLRRQLISVTRVMFAPNKIFSIEWQDNLATEAVLQSCGASPMSIRAKPFSVLAKAVGASVFIGPGQMIRGNASVFCVLFYLVIALVTRLSRGTVTLHGIGIGRMDKALHIFLWKLIGSLCGAGYFRDEPSLKQAREILGMKQNAFLCADYAFLQTDLSALFCRTVTAPTEPYIVCAPVYCQSEGRLLSSDEVATTVVASAASLKCEKIVFLLHAPGIGAEHAFFSDCEKKVRAISQSALRTRQVETFDLEIVAKLYREAALVISNRLHAVIFGLIAQKPVLVLEDGSQKLAAIARQFCTPVGSIAGSLRPRARTPEYRDALGASQALAFAAFAEGGASGSSKTRWASNALRRYRS
ncbi:polysaccharide pyruvyl transferase family protein [uncultured Thiohalocapsa sp.]|uniref:polysaccharide pyruvyl transferase family protein n=1 Tax=uncultured Thiohalocapsa sp. TaxID=768990 RepID=UPI0034598E1E